MHSSRPCFLFGFGLETHRASIEHLDFGLDAEEISLLSGVGPYKNRHPVCRSLCSNHHLDLVCLYLPSDHGDDKSLDPCHSLGIGLGCGCDGGPSGHLAVLHGRGPDPACRHGGFLDFLQEMVSAMFCGEPSSVCVGSAR